MTDQCNCDQAISQRAELDNERKRYQEACGERDAARGKAVEMARKITSKHVQEDRICSLCEYFETGHDLCHGTKCVYKPSQEAADIVEQWGSK